MTEDAPSLLRTAGLKKEKCLVTTDYFVRKCFQYFNISGLLYVKQSGIWVPTPMRTGHFNGVPVCCWVSEEKTAESGR